MAYTYSTLRSQIRDKAQDPNGLLFLDPGFNVICNNVLKRTLEKIQQTKRDFPSLSTTISFAENDVDETMPAGFWKISSIEDSTTGEGYKFGTIHDKTVKPNLDEFFLYFSGTDYLWHLLRQPMLPAVTLTVRYTYRFADLATDSTLDLTWLPQSAIDLMENKGAMECLSRFDRRNARCEFEERQAADDLNNWLQAEPVPEFVKYIPR